MLGVPDGVSFAPTPGRVKVFAGGSGPRALARAARDADVWYPMMGSPDEVAAGAAEVRRLAVEHGRLESEIEIGFSNFTVGLDPASEAIREASGAVTGAVRTTEDVVRDISAYRDVGVEWMTVWFAWETPDQLVAEIERFGRDVIPALQDETAP